MKQPLIGVRSIGTLVGALMCASIAARPAAAQQPGAPAERPGRVEVFGSVGYNGQWDDESRLGQGAGFSGGAGYRLVRGLWIEGMVNQLQSTRDLMYYQVTEGANGPSATPYPVTKTGRATYVLAQARYVFSTSRLQPYVAAAFGVMRWSGTPWAALFPPVAGLPTPPPGDAVTTAGAMGINAGLGVAVARRVTIGPYFGLLTSAVETGTTMALHGGVRVGVGW